ncbi:Uncharacterized conserved membrane protein [Oceanicola granulosus HTCC2516]|uniref:Uncharacterized conserved membrane protein n=1 Tax=Oceanicola granulosus (strain ATCC BAA-861 / DSM 15982 / KCTC 12143 / HTCC2516) TaxID=314256 RepID=Q2CG39_OCEGH|nr:DUF3307 domain-containing protein [Oceanicola granulosus]EAR51690.1 Uncharacterized conserved membrane protein [Oceanicola granulosus HTCC2516]
MMVHTFLALLLAHLAGDFLLQSARLAEAKRRPGPLLAHAAIHFALALAVTGGAPFVPLAVAATHLVIDWLKAHLAPPTLAAFLADQAAHIAVLAGLAWLFPAALAWPLPPAALTALLLATGLIAATLAGGPAVGLLMRPYQEHARLDGLEHAGRLIGQLERALIFLLILSGNAAGIGFLIAAKSILRFDTASRDQRAGEYVIIGTLASFGWAIGAALATAAALRHLPPPP